MNCIEVNKLQKSFLVGQQLIPVLNDINFTLKKGQFGIIFGPSGSGKSTLLHTILGLEKPTTGTVSILGTNLYQNTSENQRSTFRKLHVGMVYQQPNWVKSLSVVQNVAIPLLLLGESEVIRIKKAHQTLKMVKMDEWAHRHPSELSSGQQQKASLARALITNPEIIIADEPTGNLDFESGKELMEILHNFTQTVQKTVLMVTHDLGYLKYSDVAVKIQDGKIISHIEDKKILSKYAEIALN